MPPIRPQPKIQIADAAQRIAQIAAEVEALKIPMHLMKGLAGTQAKLGLIGGVVQQTTASGGIAGEGDNQ